MEENIETLYQTWCKETKRSGGILCPGSIQELFRWLKSHNYKTVKDIDDNNGWIKIDQLGSTLPNEAGFLSFVTHRGELVYKDYFSNDRQCLQYYSRLYSHYKPLIVIEARLPIY